LAESARDKTTNGIMRVRKLEQRSDVPALLQELTSPVEDGTLTVRGAAVHALGRLRAPKPSRRLPLAYEKMPIRLFAHQPP
jgi:hypothetical protein